MFVPLAGLPPAAITTISEWRLLNLIASDLQPVEP
jgi:hypothetical protein